MLQDLALLVVVVVVVLFRNVQRLDCPTTTFNHSLRKAKLIVIFSTRSLKKIATLRGHPREAAMKGCVCQMLGAFLRIS